MTERALQNREIYITGTAPYSTGTGYSTSTTSMLAASCNSGNEAASLVLYVGYMVEMLVTTCYIFTLINR